MTASRVRTRRGMRALLAGGLAWAVAAGALAAQAGGEPGEDGAAAAPPLRLSSSVQLSAGVRHVRGDSPFNDAGTASGLAGGNRRVGAVLRAARPGQFTALLDAQHEHNAFEQRTGARLNQLYVTLDLAPAWKLRLGKQRVLWGKGLSYIPTDFVNPTLDPSGIDLAKVGVPAVSVDHVTDNYSVTVLVRQETRSRPDSIGIKLATGALGGVDFDAIAYHSPAVGNALGGSFSLDAGEVLSPRLAGLVLSGGLAQHRSSRYPALAAADAGGGLAFYPVGATGAPGRYTSAMLSAAYQIDNRLGVTAEAYRIGDAWERGAYAALLRCLDARGSACAGLSSGWLGRFTAGRNQRDYQTLSLSVGYFSDSGNRFTDTLGLDLGLLRGVGDGSRHVMLSLKSNYWDRVEIGWRNFLTQGGRATEFGAQPYRWYSELGVSIAF